MKITTIIWLVAISIVSMIIFTVVILPYLDGEKDVPDVLSEAEQFCLDHEGILSQNDIDSNKSVCYFEDPFSEIPYICNVMEYRLGRCMNPNEKNDAVNNTMENLENGK